MKLGKNTAASPHYAQNSSIPLQALQAVENRDEKDKGDPKIDRLRIICLYKADCNIFLKIMWAHQLVKTCEENDSKKNANLLLLTCNQNSFRLHGP
jgi:hypothetical protein